MQAFFKLNCFLLIAFYHLLLKTQICTIETMTVTSDQLLNSFKVSHFFRKSLKF